MEVTKKEVSVEFFSEYVYAGGGKKLDRPVRHGAITLNPDGTLDVSPDDDYYGGRVSAADARTLAFAILAKEGY